MSLASELRGLLRLAVRVRGFARETVAPDAARRLVAERMRNRERRFLAEIARTVFRNSRSPYLRLLSHAGAEAGDVGSLVEREGVEGCLERLASEGVSVSWDEFKGHTPAVRGSRSFHFREHDFDNPLTRVSFVASSGGSLGAPVRVKVDLDFVGQLAPNLAAWFDVQGWGGRPLVFWTPAHTGLATRYLMCARAGFRYERWFVLADMRSPLDRLRAGTVHRLCRALVPFPQPSVGGLDRIPFVLQCLREMLDRGRHPLVNTSSSAAARLAGEAERCGWSLEGVSFLLGAEPVTPERRNAIETSGARCWPTYGTSESGWIGSQFTGATEPDEVHVFRDAYAVVPGASEPLDGPRPILVTSLLGASPKVLLNTELGDSAVFDRTPGSVSDLAFGYDLKLHTIRSFRKITAFGITLAVADLYPIVERFLPDRFGGSVGDYQLVETQDDQNASRLTLHIAPELGRVDEDAVRAALLARIGAARSQYRFMAAIVERAGALAVRRTPPVRTRGGKVLPVLPCRSEPRRPVARQDVR